MSLFWIVLCKYHDITHVIMIVLRSSAFLPTRWLIVCIGWFLIVSITDADAKNNSSWSRSLETRLLFHYRITTIYKKNRKREKLSCVWVKCLYDTYVTLCCCLVFVLCKIHRTELIELTTLFALHFEGRWCEELSLVVIMDGACMFVQLAW